MNKLPLTAYQQATHKHARLSQTDTSLVSSAHPGLKGSPWKHWSSSLLAMRALWSEVLPCGGLGKSLFWASSMTILILDLSFLSPGLTGNPLKKHICTSLSLIPFIVSKFSTCFKGQIKLLIKLQMATKTGLISRFYSP